MTEEYHSVPFGIVQLKVEGIEGSFEAEEFGETSTSAAETSTEQPNPLALSFSDAEVTINPKTGMSICMLCLMELHPADVMIHMVNEHKYRKILFKCWNCEHLFIERDELTEHKKGCQPKPFKKQTIQQLIKAATSANTCPICFNEINEPVEEHFERVHNKRRVVYPNEPSPCPICKKVFKSKMNLAQHKRYVHVSKQNSVNCPECGKQFQTQKYLTNHLRNVHPNDGKHHICEECGKDFKSHQSLHQHMKQVHGINRSREQDPLE